MDNTTLEVIVDISTFFITALAFVDSMRNLGRFEFIKSFSFKISFLALVYFIFVLANCQRQKNIENEQSERDSTTIYTYTTALAKYGLKYDSAQKRIERLVQDSLHHTINNTIHNYGPDPTFGLCPDDGIWIEKKTKDSLIIHFNYCLKNAPTNIQVYFSIIGINNYKTHMVAHSTELFRNNNIDLTSRQNLRTNNLLIDTITSQRYILHMRGSYWSNDLSKSFPMDFVYAYDWKTGMSVPLHPFDKRIRKEFLRLDTAKIKLSLKNKSIKE